ncbi:hypothetical protein V8C35DRAFT_141044 [Trichoderma chlorosporum]
MAQNVFLYFPETYCILCRKGVPYYSRKSAQSEPPSTWEKEVVSFFDLSSRSSQGPKVFALETALHARRPTVEQSLTVQHEGVKTLVHIVCERPNAKYRPLFFAHQICFKVVKSLRGKVDYSELYDIALLSHELLPKDCWSEELPSRLASFTSTIESGVVDTENTNLGACLLRCSKLPIELQNDILTHVHGHENSLAFSLMTALQTFTVGRSQSSKAIPNHPSFRKLQPADYVEVAHVSASFINLFGLCYARDIEVFHRHDHRDSSDQKCIEVKINSICQIEFLVGMYGITAIRFHLDDNSVSPWLGDAGKGWRCKPIRITRSDLRFPIKGQKGLVQRFDDLLTQTSWDGPLNVLWDGVSTPFHGSLSFIARLHTELHNMKPGPFPGRPMCRYLPLYFDGQHARAITVYLFNLGTSCIVVHGKTARQQVSASKKKGVSMTFYFKEGEEIVTLGLITTGPSGRRCGPFLLFKTSLNRMAYFGPRMSLLDDTAEWVSMIPDHLDKKCTAMGLIVDQAAISFGSYRTFGARCMLKEGVSTRRRPPTSSFERHLELPGNPRILRRTPFKSFAVVTQARFFDIKQLRVLKKEARNFDNHPMDRFSGLWILHGDGSVETIGCWDESLTETAKVLYDEADGKLTRVIFRLKDGRNVQCETDYVRFVAEITVRVIPPGSDEKDRNEEASAYNEIGDFFVYCKIAWKKKVSTHAKHPRRERNTASALLTGRIKKHRLLGPLLKWPITCRTSPSTGKAMLCHRIANANYCR